MTGSVPAGIAELEALAAPVGGAVLDAPHLTIAPPPASLPSLDLAQLSITARGPVGLRARETLRRRLLAAVDAVALLVALLVGGLSLDAGGAFAVAAVPAALVLFKLAGLYDRDELRLHHSTLDEAPLVLQLTGFFTLGCIILSRHLATAGIAAGQVATVWMVSFATVFGGRVMVRALVRRLTPGERCLIVGDAHRAERIRGRIASSGARTEVVECLDVADVVGSDDALSTVLAVVRHLQIDRVIVASISMAAEDAAELVRIAKVTGVRVSVVPEILETAGSAVAFDELEGMVMLGLPRFGLRRSSRHLKRLFDLVLTIVGLVVLGPLLLWIAIAIRLDSRGPVFFRQTRIGRHGRAFEIVKFRSMVIDAEAQKDSLRSRSLSGPGLFKLADDPRVTRVGRVLRITSLDELPQLFNVLRGDMTLVGPRPLVPDEDAQIQGLGRSRLLLAPGLTGPWQLMGRRVPLQEMVEIDYLYASSWSLWLDLKLLLRTVRHVARRGNL